MGTVQDSRRILNSLSPMDIPNLQLHIKQFPLKKIWKLAENPLPQQRIKRPQPHQDGQERQKCSVPKNPTPGVANHNWEGPHKYGASSRGLRGSSPTSHTPDLYQRDKPSGCLALKTSEAYILKAKSAVRNGDSAVKRLALKFTCSEIQCKSSSF